MEDDLKLYCIFNKKTKAFTCFVTSIEQFPESIRSTLLIKEYTLKELGFRDDEVNLTRFKWMGDYDTGRLVDIVNEKKAIVSEREQNEKFFNMFWTRYSIHDIIQELLLNSEMKTQKGIEMKTFLEKVLDTKNKDIERYKNSPIHIWESEDETIKRQKDAFR